VDELPLVSWSLNSAKVVFVGSAARTDRRLVVTVHTADPTTRNKTRRLRSMDTLAARLDKKLREWSPETAEQVRFQVAEIIELADQGLLDIVRSRQVEQEVLDILDEATSR
jgi:hypothetical protein